MFLYLLHTENQNARSTSKVRTFWLVLNFKGLIEGWELVSRLGLELVSGQRSSGHSWAT